jgi:hypothetical protein
VNITSAVFHCRDDCPLIVAQSNLPTPREGATGETFVTGAGAGELEEVTLSASPLGGLKVTTPLIVVLKGAVQEELRLPAVTSVFISITDPCVRPDQTIVARGMISGEGFSMEGSDPLGCFA